MAIVYITVFLDLLGFGIILPLLPYYAKLYGATGVTLGVLTTAYSAAQFLGAPLIGALSDRYGRRPVLLLTLLGSALSLAYTGMASTLTHLTVARFLAGLCGGSIAAAQAYVADMSTSENRAKYMGILGACIGLGFVLGPALGAALSSYGFSAAAFAAATLAGLNFFWALVKLPESLIGKGKKSSSTFSLSVLRAAVKQQKVRPILGASFLTTFAFVAMETTYPLLSNKQFDFQAKDLGNTFAFIGMIMIIIQGGLLGRLVRIAGEKQIALFGMIITACSLVLLPLASTALFSIAFLGFLAVGQGLSSPTLSTILSRAASQDKQGSTLGIGQSLAAFARATGPICAGFLFDHNPIWPYVFGGILTIFGIFWLFLAEKRVSDEGTLG